MTSKTYTRIVQLMIIGALILILFFPVILALV
jgi:hypothetical protein